MASDPSVVSRVISTSFSDAAGQAVRGPRRGLSAARGGFKENGIEFADASPGLILVPGSISRTQHARSACGGWVTLSDPDGGLAPRHSAHALLKPVVGALV